MLGPDLDKMWPLIPHGQSDTACLDNALELLVAGGYPLAHAVMMLIPEAWAGNPMMDAKRKAFYEYHAALMEPWDGPAAMAFTDGRQIGATLDRNGLRPARYIDHRRRSVILASESGVLPVPEEKIKRKWRLQPGKMLLIDLEEGRIIEDEEIKKKFSEAEPYEDWLKGRPVQAGGLARSAGRSSRQGQRSFDCCSIAAGVRLHPGRPDKFFLEPMATGATIPIGSMGADTPDRGALEKAQAALQLFQAELRPGHQSADRSDPRRTGDEPGVDDRAAPQPAGPRCRRAQAPGSRPADPDQCRCGEDPLDFHELVDGAFRTATIDCTWPASEGRGRPGTRSISALPQRHRPVLADNNILILSDRAVSADRIPDPGGWPPRPCIII